MRRHNKQSLIIRKNVCMTRHDIKSSPDLFKLINQTTCIFSFYICVHDGVKSCLLFFPYFHKIDMHTKCVYVTTLCGHKDDDDVTFNTKLFLTQNCRFGPTTTTWEVVTVTKFSMSGYVRVSATTLTGLEKRCKFVFMCGLLCGKRSETYIIDPYMNLGFLVKLFNLRYM